MSRTKKPLTDTEIRKAKPKEKEYPLSDGNGLILRVKPNGSKIWLFNYYHPVTKKKNKCWPWNVSPNPIIRCSC